MTKKSNTLKSLVDQILDQMFEAIEERDEFDANSIENLKQLTSSGDLTNVKQVIKAIRIKTEEAS